MKHMEKYLELKKSVYDKLISIIDNSSVYSKHKALQKCIDISSFSDEFDELICTDGTLFLINKDGYSYSINAIDYEFFIKLVDSISELNHDFGLVNIEISGNGFIKEKVYIEIKKVLSKLQGERHLFVDGEEINPYIF